MNKDRRQFLLSGWKIGGALLGGAAVYTAYEALRPLVTVVGGGKIKLGDPKFYVEGSATYIPEGRLYIVNPAGTLLALSQKCPHLGCRVPFCESSGRFECPCHGTIFDLGGEYLAGPSPRGMDRYPVEVDATSAVVDAGTLITGPSRGAKKYYQPARGPSCVKDE